MNFSRQGWDVRPGSWWRGAGAGWGPPHGGGGGGGGGGSVPEEVVRKGFLEELWSYNLEDA